MLRNLECQIKDVTPVASAELGVLGQGRDAIGLCDGLDHIRSPQQPDPGRDAVGRFNGLDQITALQQPDQGRDVVGFSDGLDRI